jgi:hypothetical protein
MAAGVLSPPGTKVGPCLEPCKHRDCAETRRMAESACTICGKPIGYDTRFYRDDTDSYVHAVCFERDEREKRSQR